MITIRSGFVVAATAVATLAAAAAGTASAAEPDRPGVVRGGNTWQLRDALNGGAPSLAFTYGSTADTWHLTGDWDGNGSRTPAVVRAAHGRLVWYLRNANSTGPSDVPAFEYGVAGDVPLAGDWDGDGRTSVGVLRYNRDLSSSPRWLLRNSTTAGGAQVDFVYGPAGTFTPVVGDWDGDGADSIGVVQPTALGLRWRVRETNASGVPDRDFFYGAANDVPVVGDWDGDGIGVAQSTNGVWRWKLRQKATPGGYQYNFLYGPATSTPVIWT